MATLSPEERRLARRSGVLVPDEFKADRATQKICSKIFEKFLNSGNISTDSLEDFLKDELNASI